VISHLLQGAQDPSKDVAVHWIPNPAKGVPIDSLGQLQKLASTFDHVDGLFYFTMAVCIFFFVLITGVLFYSVVKYRRKTFDQPAAANITHNTPLEVIWTVIPLIIVMVMFAWGWKGSLDMTVVPADARQYKALAKQWSWTFFYPNDKVPSFGELWLEVDKPAAFALESTDVLHAFFMPSMRVKRDVIPGRFQTVWFTPKTITNVWSDPNDDHERGLDLFCAEYCGQNHSTMYAKVHVVSAADYAKRPWDQFDDSTPENALKSGGNLYSALCASCHTTNDTILLGPSWKGIWGKEEEVVEAGQRKKVKVDKDYVLESVRKPDQKKVVGFENKQMTPFDDKMLPDNRVNAIIEYMKTLAPGAGGGKK
jgi:cytochrome c oxidase subunit 2